MIWIADAIAPSQVLRCTSTQSSIMSLISPGPGVDVDDDSVTVSIAAYRRLFSCVRLQRPLCSFQKRVGMNAHMNDKNGKTNLPRKNLVFFRLHFVLSDYKRHREQQHITNAEVGTRKNNQKKLKLYLVIPYLRHPPQSWRGFPPGSLVLPQCKHASSVFLENIFFPFCGL